MLMSLTTRLCPNRPDNSWRTTTVVAIPMPFSSEPYKVLTGQTPFARKSSGVKSENLLVYPLLYAPAGRRGNQNINTKESGGPISGISGLGKWRFGEPTAFFLRWHHGWRSCGGRLAGAAQKKKARGRPRTSSSKSDSDLTRLPQEPRSAQRYRLPDRDRPYPC